MKFLIVFVSTILACNAAPSLYGLHPTLYSSWQVAAAPVVSHVVAPAVTQYHAQDELGQYSYGYAGGPSAKSEVKTLDGVTRGSYSYVDANAKLQTVEYVADALGFRVAATNLPTAPVDNGVAPVDNGVAPPPVEDTVEVKQARAEHLAAVAKAQSESSDDEAAEAVELVAPEPVEDTPEVKQARAEHLQAVEVAKARAAEPETIIVQQPQLIQHAALAYHAAPAAAIHLAPSPLWRSPASFGYSVVAPGHPNLIYA